MNDYKMEDLDRLSELPPSLFLHILSFLPMRDAISTTLASKGLENLWTTLPCLNFSQIIDPDAGELDCHRLRNFINRALICWRGAKLLKFTIEIEDHFDMSLAGDMNLWVRFAVDNKVQELNIGLMYHPEAMEWVTAVTGSKKDVYWAPQCLNSCSSIRKLSLVGCNLRIHGYPAWNQLESLKIDGFFFSECLINRILLATPLLKVFELRLIENNENLNIRSASLKILKIEKDLYLSDEQPSLSTMLRICCPNLETLEISGIFYIKCLFTDLSSLTDATLGFNGSGYYDARGRNLLGETMRHIFSTFQHVERVTLSSCSLKVLRASQKNKLFSPLPNVGFLEVEVFLNGLVEVVNLLGIFPNLKMLGIEGDSFGRWTDFNADKYLESETNLSKSSLLQLKIIEITSKFYESSIFRWIEFFLKHCSMLEKLVIRAKGIEPLSQARLLDVSETLLSMPRSSPIAKVIFQKR